MDRRTFILTGSAAVAGGVVVGEFSSVEAQTLGYDAAFNFAADGTFAGTIIEPDGVVNDLVGYHGTAPLPALGGSPVSSADVVLSGSVDYPSGFTVLAGEVWELDPTADTTVTVAASIVVNGTLRAHPNADVTHTIRFVGVNEADTLGAPNGTPITDVGLWVLGGTLDVSGTPKVAWNRTGGDASWSPTDELLAAPTSVGDYFAQSFTGSVASVSTDTLNAGSSYEITHTFSGEVFNMTRNVVVESVDGRAHIIVMGATGPQRFEYAELRNLGVAGKLGRYPLHIHMNGDATDGSLFRGNVAKNCGNHAFVPHLSNGCDMSYSIAYRTTGSAFWWDLNDEAERVNWNRCAAIETYGAPGFTLGEGLGNTCSGSVVVGNTGNTSQGGFLWPSQANGDRNMWLVEDCVAHNNQTDGFRVWQNDTTPHVIARCVSYRNGGAGFGHGAYVNRYRYFQCVGFDNYAADFVAHALGSWSSRFCWFDRVHLTRHSQAQSDVIVMESTWGYPVRAVTVAEQSPNTGPAHGGTFRFVSSNMRSDLDPSDVVVTGTQLSIIEVVNAKAASFTLTP